MKETVVTYAAPANVPDLTGSVVEVNGQPLSVTSSTATTLTTRELTFFERCRWSLRKIVSRVKRMSR